MKLPVIAEDKANHLVYGMIICLIVSVLLSFFIPKFQASLVGFFTTLLFASGKEFLDYRANEKAQAVGLEVSHGVEFADIIATMSGALLVVLSRSF